MPTLDFKGKPFVYSHHLSVPFRELKIDAGKSLPGDGGPSLDDNLIIHGDNLHALKALLPKYAGKVDVIYIDPPYNTGNEGWAYNDNVNSPLMKEWLGQVVDGEDLERHDKWCCMMWPRLTLLRELLSDEGIILISIDENEHHNLRAIADEIFDRSNWIADFVWHSSGHSDNQYDVKINHEYVCMYSKDKFQCSLGDVIDPNTREESNLWKGFAENSITKNGPKNPPSEVLLPKGFPCKSESLDLSKTDASNQFFQDVEDLSYISRDITKKYKVQYPIRLDPIKVENGKLLKKARVFAGWANKKKLIQFCKNNFKPILEDNGDKVSFYLSPKGVIYYHREREAAKNIVSVLLNFKTSEKMKSELEDLGLNFDNPKPEDLIAYLLKVAKLKKDKLVLDSFAGSGTTAHAVQALNAEDGGNRKFILVETEDYADSITAERVRRVMKGVPKAKDEALKNGLGGSFTYCDLGEPIDMESFFGDSKSMPAYNQLASYIAYTATGEALGKVPKKPAKDWFIGELGGVRLYLIYKPDSAFMKSHDAALDMDTVKTIAAGNKAGAPSYVFAAAKYMGQKELSDNYQITFCQLPYAIHRIMGDGVDG